MGFRGDNGVSIGLGQQVATLLSVLEEKVLLQGRIHPGICADMFKTGKKKKKKRQESYLSVHLSFPVLNILPGTVAGESLSCS